ncbi:MAG: DUF262 domain-containing protein [Planctomycetota bacterium]
MPDKGVEVRILSSVMAFMVLAQVVLGADNTPCWLSGRKRSGRSIEQLVSGALAGRYRIPALQRPLRWNAKNAVDLLDSIRRAF